MKRRYRIDREKALRRFQKHAEEGPAEVQLHLPLKEAAAALQEGADRLMRQAGLERRQLVLREEVRPLAGKTSKPTAGTAKKAPSQPFRSSSAVTSADFHAALGSRRYQAPVRSTGRGAARHCANPPAGCCGKPAQGKINSDKANAPFPRPSPRSAGRLFPRAGYRGPAYREGRCGRGVRRDIRKRAR